MTATVSDERIFTHPTDDPSPETCVLISDERRPPFCYQTHDALDAIRARFDGAKRTTAIAVYVVLTEFANREGGAAAREAGFRAARTDLAESIGISVDTLDRYVLDFTDAGLVGVHRERVGEVNLPNVWTLLEVRTGAPSSRTHAATPGRTGAAQGKEEPRKEPTPDGVEIVSNAWRENAPPLIVHRASYFAAPRAQSAIRAAVKVYPADDVAEAIRLHALVLGGDGYQWSYRWTLIDFLKRGLDRFVPESDPLGNMPRSRFQSAARSQVDEL